MESRVTCRLLGAWDAARRPAAHKPAARHFRHHLIRPLHADAWYLNLHIGMMRPALFVLVAACLASQVAAHGFLAEPAARNVLANSDYCPQCLNAGGPGVVGGGGKVWPAGSHGICGKTFSV